MSLDNIIKSKYNDCIKSGKIINTQTVLDSYYQGHISYEEYLRIMNNTDDSCRYTAYNIKKGY